MLPSANSVVVVIKAPVELGVDPLRTNKKQINVLHLMAKRNQVEMARRCLEAVRADPARAINFVNNSSNIGESCVTMCLHKS